MGVSRCGSIRSLRITCHGRSIGLNLPRKRRDEVVHDSRHTRPRKSPLGPSKFSLLVLVWHPSPRKSHPRNDGLDRGADAAALEGVGKKWIRMERVIVWTTRAR